jgi:aminoglycoside phosphotransferase (APT) family kinase protein
VPVAPVVASGRDDGFGAGWMILDRLDGETIPRKLLRDPEYAGARASLVGQCARALAALHRLTPADLPGLAGGDQLAQFGEVLHALGTPRPALELALRRLDATRPSEGAPTVVHGDFRTGNLLVDRQGLRAVLDWELAHVGDPLEDLGWFCVRAWRFGSAGRAGGFGSDDALVTEYERAGGRSVDRTALRWWEAVGTFKWAVMCMLQAASHRSGGRRSVELAAVGRRVCENEWDLLHLLDVSPPDESPLSAAGPGAVGAEVFGRPTAAELVDAVREFVTTDIMGHTNGRLHFDARVAGNALAMVGRELALGPAVVERAAERLRRLGFDDERSLCRAIVDGACDDRVDEVAGAVAGSVRDQLAVANPRHLLPDG